MNTSVLHDDEGFVDPIGDSGILFEHACGRDNLQVLHSGETTAITFGERGVRNAECIYVFYEHIVKLLEQNRCRVLSLDMRGVWFLPSRTLGALISLRKRVERVELQNVSDELRETLLITQLDQMFHITSFQEVQISDVPCHEDDAVVVEGDVDDWGSEEGFGVRPREPDDFLRGDAVTKEGRITQISLSRGPEFPQHGCGVISTPNGGEVYFRADSLKNVEFSRLELGSEVRFVQEQGEGEPHATSVWLVAPHFGE